MRRAIALVTTAAGLLACAPAPATGYDWDLPPGYPIPVVPTGNPMSEERVELGHYLFYDTRMSGNGTYSCGSCHQQAHAFTDTLPVSVGSTGDHTPRGAMSLVNVAYNPVQTWANPNLVSLEDQALVPMFGAHPDAIELGLSGMEDALVQRIAADPMYPPMFAAAFPGETSPITVANIVRAIACFERTMISTDSPYDRYTYRGDSTAMSESARRGMALFFAERMDCFHCHGGFNFTDNVMHGGTVIPGVQYHNTGLYNLDGRGAYPAPNRGLYEITHEARDMGAFRAPTLRMIMLTAPYFHDGSAETIDDVLDHYAAGGRTITSGPNAGVGAESPLKSIFVHGFTLTAEERADAIAFLESLTDPTFLTDPRFSDPFARQP
ncbi:MAG: di-heme enzyme [Sandaracinus sp.]